MEGFYVILPIVFIISLGWFFNKIGIFSRETAPKINDLLFWGIIPLMLFRLVFKAGKLPFANNNLLLALTLSQMLIPALGWLFALLRRPDKKSLAVSVMVSIRSNNVYLGIPVISLALGEPGLEALSVILAVVMPGYHFFSIAWGQAALTGEISFKSIKSIAWKLITNPLLIACVSAVIVSFAGLEKLPRWLDESMKIVGDSASALALMSIGVGVDLQHILRFIRSTWSDIIFKLFLHPLLLMLFFRLWPIDPFYAKIAILTAAMPAAVNSYIVASGMGMDAPYAGHAIISTTVISVFTLPLWMWILGI